MKDLSYAEQWLSHLMMSGVNDQVHHAWVLVDRSGGVRLLLFVWPEVAKVLRNLIGLKAWTNSSLDVRSS